ncbi:MAG: helix-turn-helix transcriptional regulator [Armatimonadetes bacterium]|nr:helix-turn-helix transcriptional regulator [Armatimonadota bacterium]
MSQFSLRPGLTFGTILVTLGENIANLRRQQGWTQALLAEKMDVHTNHASRWETNRQRRR